MKNSCSSKTGVGRCDWPELSPRCSPDKGKQAASVPIHLPYLCQQFCHDGPVEPNHAIFGLLPLLVDGAVPTGITDTPGYKTLRSCAQKEVYNLYDNIGCPNPAVDSCFRREDLRPLGSSVVTKWINSFCSNSVDSTAALDVWNSYCSRGVSPPTAGMFDRPYLGCSRADKELSLVATLAYTTPASASTRYISQTAYRLQLRPHITLPKPLRLQKYWFRPTQVRAPS